MILRAYYSRYSFIREKRNLITKTRKYFSNLVKVTPIFVTKFAKVSPNLEFHHLKLGDTILEIGDNFIKLGDIF